MTPPRKRWATSTLCSNVFATLGNLRPRTYHVGMASRETTPIDALAAPREDGEVLIWPNTTQLVELAETNRRRLADCPRMILGRSIGQWRRTALGERRIIMTGHQPSFLHPGVWAKGVVVAELARRTGGQAAFLVVDSDVSRGIELNRPQVRDGVCRVRPVVFSPDRRLWSFEDVVGEADAWRGFFDPLPHGAAAYSAFVDGFVGRLGQAMGGYVDRWITGMRAFEEKLRVQDLTYRRASEIFGAGRDEAGSAAAFVAHLMLHADTLATDYNASLAAYRARRGVRGADHPVPDLITEAGRCELPLWATAASQARRRMFVSREGGARVGIWADKVKVADVETDRLRASPASLLPAALAGWRIRPRALALTMYARLLACDLFIHGVDGAKYDQITDDLIRRFFDIEPPAYACVSATLRLPLPVSDVQEDDLRDCQRRIRDLRFNPHRASDRLTSLEVFHRREKAIAESGRLRSEEPRNRDARRLTYEAIRQFNDELVGDRASAAIVIQQQLAAVQAKLESNRIARSREWFIGWHSAEQLGRLRDALITKLDVLR